jgi:hypothetical protein
VLPPGTTTLREVSRVTNGKCRFTCHEDPLCSGYKWTGNNNHCTLLQAPSHLSNAAENAAWHKSAAHLVGMPYTEEKPAISPRRLVEAESAIIPPTKKVQKLTLHQQIGKLIVEAKEETAAAMAAATPNGVEKTTQAAKRNLKPLEGKVAALRMLQEKENKKGDSDEIKKQMAKLKKAQGKYQEALKTKRTAQRQLEKAKAAKLLGDFKVTEIKLYAKTNLKKVADAIEPAVARAAREKAKATLRKKENMDILAKASFKTVDKDIERLTGTYKTQVRTDVVGKLNADFVLDLQKYVVDKAAIYKQKVLNTKLAALDKVEKEQRKAP